MADMLINYFSYPVEDNKLSLPKPGEIDVWQVQAEKEAWTGKSTPSRKVLKGLLSRYLGLKESAIKIEEGPHGKPYLASPLDQCLSFNLSHSGPYLMLAFSTHRDIGIDLESLDHAADEDAIAKRFFHPKETKALAALTGEEKTKAFFRIWTMKEAFLKGLGWGLTWPTTAFTFVSLPDGSFSVTTKDSRPENTKNLPEDLSSWRLIPIDAPEGHLASLAFK